MFRYQKGNQAKKGYYLNLTDGELVHHERDGKLPSHIDGKLIRFPSLLAILAAPVVSLIYVVFLPLAGIAAAFAAVVLKIKSLRVPKNVIQDNA